MKREFVVDFAKLDQKTKHQYLEFLLANQIKMQSNNGGDFVASIKVKQKPHMPQLPPKPTTKSHGNIKK